MQTPQKPDNEEERLKALQETCLLDSLPEERFDRLTRLAQQLFQVPIALVSLVDSDRQWFKSKQGLDASETGRDISFCGHTILGQETFEIPNATLDPRFSDNPLVTGPPDIRFYAGAPITAANNIKIGTLCIIDTKPRELSDEQRQSLLDLAKCVSNEIYSERLKEDEEELKIERRRLADIIEGTRIGTWEWNVQTGETVFNERWAEIIGYTLKELEPISIETWMKVAHPDDLKESGELLEKCFSRELDYYDFEARMRHKEGHWVWVHDRGKVIRWTDDGKPLYMSGTHADITEKKLNEQSVAAHIKFQSLIFESIPALLFVKDEQFRIVQCNSRFLEVYPEQIRSKIIGTSTVENYKKVERDKFLAEDRKAFDSGYSETEETVHFPNGNKRVLWTTKTRFYDANEIPFILGVAIDITDQKSAESARDDFGKRLSIATKAAGVGIWDWDVVNNVLTWDDQMLRLYGLTKEKFVGAYEAWQNGLHPSDRERGEKEIQLALEGKGDFDTQFRVVWPNGEVRHIKAAATIERDASGNPIRMIGTNWDITVLKNTEIKLIAAKEKAEIATKVKGEFLANMSHEIRTPMNGVLGMLDIALKKATDREQKRRLQLAQSSATSLLTVINDILDFSKIEAGQLEFECVAFDIEKLLSDCVASFSPNAHGKGLQIVLDSIALPSLLVLGDPSRLKQVLSNLIHNAIKFTQNGEVIVRASLEDMDSQHWRFVCSVIDTGIGISTDKTSTLFNPFTQADASTTRQYGGTGLGLSIVRQLCELMHGHIQVESTENKGSNFTFDIRLQKMESYEPKPNINFNKVSVFLVDEHAASRKAISDLLKSWGMDVTETDKKGLPLARSAGDDPHKFSFALVDQAVLEDNSCKSLILETITDTPIFKRILLASSLESTDNLDLANIGFGEVITKPLTPSDLLDTLITLEEKTDSKPKNPGNENLTEQTESNYLFPGLDQKPRILLVEDSEINQEVASSVLEDFGLEVDCANNGAEAIDLLKASNTNQPYALILMDCQMPVMDGYQATQEIRLGHAGLHFKHIPIIAMTANAMAGEKEKCLDAGMNDYVSKPIDQEHLMVTLKLFLNRQ